MKEKVNTIIVTHLYNNKQGSVTYCPRQPWHDLHSQVDGPAAYDILTNFEERWLRALKMHRYQKMRSSHDDSLLKIDRIPDIVGIDEVPCQNENNRETWHVQVYYKLCWKIDKLIQPPISKKEFLLHLRK